MNSRSSSHLNRCYATSNAVSIFNSAQQLQWVFLRQGEASRTSALNSNYGYTGILVAFVARQNPLAVVLIAILLGGILSSGSLLQRAHSMPDATVLVLQGFIFLAILYSESLYGRFSWFQERSLPDPGLPDPGLPDPGLPASLKAPS